MKRRARVSEYGREGKEGGERAGQIEKSEREREYKRERESESARGRVAESAEKERACQINCTPRP